MEQLHSLPARKFSHLENGVKPITVCLDIFNPNKKFKEIQELGALLKGAQEIPYAASPTERTGYEIYCKDNGIQYHHSGAFAISAINEKNKFSRDYFNCTGLVMIGTDKKTKENISVLTHQNPAKFLGQQYAEQELEEAFTETIKKFMAQCEQGSVDALFVGGKKKDWLFEEYMRMLEKISRAISPLLGFSPRIATGPKLTDFHATSVFLDTKNRRLYLLMPRQPSSKTYEDLSVEGMKQKFQEYELEE